MVQEHPDTYQIGEKVVTKRNIRGWFDYSEKDELPADSIGTIFKIHKLTEELESIIYTVQFDQEFGYVDIKHSDLERVV